MVVTPVKCLLYIHLSALSSSIYLIQILLHRTEKYYPISHFYKEYTTSLVEMAAFTEDSGYESKNLIDTSVTIAQSSTPSINTIGESRRKARFDFINVLALLVSFLLLALAYVVVEPQLPISWYLGFQQQLTIIGLLLTLQSLCLKRLSTKTFLLIEANFTSRLQNYDAILSNSVFANRANFFWRLTLLSFIALPILLSVGYKQYIGGFSSLSLEGLPHSYGPTGPPGINIASHQGPTIMTNITLPFLAATSDDKTAPSFSSLPQAFGFNILLLSKSSAAALDAPVPDFVSNIQRGLKSSETWQLRAPVNGLVATHNSSLDSYRDNPSFWNSPLIPSMKGPLNHHNGGLYTADIFNHWAVGFLAWLWDGPPDQTWCMFSIQPSGDGPENRGFDHIAAFRKRAQLFNLTRQNCEGTWTITSNSIQLVDGTCSGKVVPWTATPGFDLTNTSMALQNYYMPSISEAIASFSEHRNGSAWLIPTMATVAAAMHWSRIAALRINGLQIDPANTYPLQDEITSFRPTLRTSPVLYVILAIQPFLTLIFSIINAFLHSTPLDNGFGIVAILAGVDPASLPVLRGAALSGQLKRRVPLRISIEAGEDSKTANIVYTIDDKGKNGRLKARQVIH